MPFELTPHNIIPGTAGILVGYGLHVVAPLVFLVIALVRMTSARKQARTADAEGLANRALTPGRGSVHGPVEYAPGVAFALNVTIHQRGENKKGKHGWSHVWRETGRTVRAAPFYVADARGSRVRVVPDERTLLVDAMDKTVRHDETSRSRTAELSEGERVYVVGDLVPEADPSVGGYRDAAKALVMKAPAAGRLLVSSEPLGDRFRSMAARQRAFAIAFFVFLFGFGLIDVPFHARLLVGHRAVGTVVATEKHGGKGPYCAVRIELDGQADTIGVNTSPIGCSILKPASKMNLVLVGERRFAQAGSVPGIDVNSLIIGIVFLFLVLVLYAARSRPWYEAKLEEGGSGKLAESP